MSSNDYHFVTHWRVEGSVQEITEILGNAADLPRWWPSVYLEVKVLQPGDKDGVGQVVDLYTKGWLPYTLRWQFRVAGIEPGRQIQIEALGDFVGRGVWTFEPEGTWVNITYDWNISAQKPLLRSLSGLLKPIFSANHHWAMAKGHESLLLELQRRRASTPQDRSLIPAPPPPTPTSPLPLLIGVGAIAWIFFRVMRALFGRS